MLVYLRMKNSSACPGFINTGYLGEKVNEDAKWVYLKNTCTILDALSVDQAGGRDIKTNFMTVSAVTNGVFMVKKTEVSSTREVESDDEFLKGYYGSLEAFGESKLKVKKATRMPDSGIINPNARN